MRANSFLIIRHLVVVVALLTGVAAMAYEEPSYQVVHTGEGYEIRQYGERVAAQVITSGGQSGAFRLLFEYISGANTVSSKMDMTVPVTQSEKVAMTVPVLQSKSEQMGLMQFFLPSQYTIQTAPKPTNSRVEIVSVEGGYYAVASYRGRASDQNFARAKAELLGQLANDDYPILGEVIRATYNGPFTPPFMRRNEAMVRVRFK